METYYSPQITVNLCQPSDIIAVSIINGGFADQDTPVQVKEDNDFFFDWGDVLVNEGNE